MITSGRLMQLLRVTVGALLGASILAAPGADAALPAFDGNVSLVVPSGGSSTTVVVTKRLPLTGDLLRAAPTMLSGLPSENLTLVVLRSLDHAPDQSPAQIALGKVPDVHGGHVVRIPSGVNRDSGKDIWFGEKWLAPGRYQLYAVASRAGTLRLSMGGKAPTKSLRLSARQSAATLETPPLIVGGNPSPSSAQGHTVDLASTGLAFRVLAVDLSAELGEYSVGSCTYRDGPPAGTWLPGCPGGLTTLLSTGFVYLDGRQHLSVGAVPELAAGRWGIGSYYQFLGTPRSVRHYQAFLTY